MPSVEFSLQAYDFPATLAGGQAFRWQPVGDAWEGVIQGRWVRLTPRGDRLLAETAVPVSDWAWLVEYLALDEDLEAVVATFPDDEPMRAATAAAHGLRLLRQDPWECLASFILSSTKQIVQIQECVRLLAERFGERIPEGGAVGGGRAVYTFPHWARLAAAGEAELRACKLGFRAPYLLGTAKMLFAGDVQLGRLKELATPSARTELERFPGVGRKIADCVLLFAYRRQDAFPVDVWVQQALQHLYFPKARKLVPDRLRRLSETHFGPNPGYAQQYLFHYARTVLGRRWSAAVRKPLRRQRKDSRGASRLLD